MYLSKYETCFYFHVYVAMDDVINVQINTYRVTYLSKGMTWFSFRVYVAADDWCNQCRNNYVQREILFEGYDLFLLPCFTWQRMTVVINVEIITDKEIHFSKGITCLYFRVYVAMDDWCSRCWNKYVALWCKDRFE